MAFASKKEDESGLSSYYNNKTTIIQEARVFNESPISPRKCRALLTRIVYLLYVGETFGTQEATTLFFGTTKLFQHKDVSVAGLGAIGTLLIKHHRRARCDKWCTWQLKSWQLHQKMSLWSRVVL
jgi:hypothetical protein